MNQALASATSGFADISNPINHQHLINELNKSTNGGAVFITGKIPAGTAINVRRSRYNVRTRTTDKVYSFAENGIQASPCKEMLKRYQEYFLKLQV